MERIAQAILFHVLEKTYSFITINLRVDNKISMLRLKPKQQADHCCYKIISETRAKLE